MSIWVGDAKKREGGLGLIGFKVICIALVAEVFVFPILQSPHDVALIFRTCQLHTAENFCMKMAAVSIRYIPSLLIQFLCTVCTAS